MRAGLCASEGGLIPATAGREPRPQPHPLTPLSGQLRRLVGEGEQGKVDGRVSPRYLAPVIALDTNTTYFYGVSYRSPDCAFCHSFLPAHFSDLTIHVCAVPVGERRADTSCLGNANPDYPRQRSVDRSRPQGVSQPCRYFVGRFANRPYETLSL